MLNKEICKKCINEWKGWNEHRELLWEEQKKIYCRINGWPYSIEEIPNFCIKYIAHLILGQE